MSCIVFCHRRFVKTFVLKVDLWHADYRVKSHPNPHMNLSKKPGKPTGIETRTVGQFPPSGKQLQFTASAGISFV
jgi:hypothetical protein